MKRNQNFDHNHSQKVLSCRYNMDTPTGWKPNLKMAPPFPLIVSPLRTSTATPRHSGRNWTGCYTTSPWSMPSLCWVEGWIIIFPSAATMAGWRIEPQKTRGKTANRAARAFQRKFSANHAKSAYFQRRSMAVAIGMPSCFSTSSACCLTVGLTRTFSIIVFSIVITSSQL